MLGSSLSGDSIGWKFPHKGTTRGNSRLWNSPGGLAARRSPTESRLAFAALLLRPFTHSTDYQSRRKGFPLFRQSRAMHLLAWPPPLQFWPSQFSLRIASYYYWLADQSRNEKGQVGWRAWRSAPNEIYERGFLAEKWEHMYLEGNETRLVTIASV
jgi:hypothetical protein